MAGMGDMPSTSLSRVFQEEGFRCGTLEARGVPQAAHLLTPRQKGFKFKSTRCCMTALSNRNTT